MIHFTVIKAFTGETELHPWQAWTVCSVQSFLPSKISTSSKWSQSLGDAQTCRSAFSFEEKHNSCVSISTDAMLDIKKNANKPFPQEKKIVRSCVDYFTQGEAGFVTA